MISTILRWGTSSVACSSLIDSGVEGNFLDETWAVEHGLPLHKLKETPTAFALDGRALSNIWLATAPVSLATTKRQFLFWCFVHLWPPLS